jgi:2-phosphosulfolactate phosphatase
MMQIQTHFTPHDVDEIALREKTAVVIDVLRASTTVITALSNGAREVIPTPTVEAAAKIAGHLAGDVTIRGGEQNGRTIDGFSIGNSPLEYVEERVRDRSIVYSTREGSPLFLKAKYAKHMLVCGFVNISAVAGFLKEHAADIEILCAGNNGRFAIEDAVCAGMLVHLLGEEADAQLALCDASIAAHSLYRTHYRNLHRMLRQSESGKFLEGLGYLDDLRYCAGVDTVPVLPVLEDNMLRLWKDNDRRESPGTPASA